MNWLVQRLVAFLLRFVKQPWYNFFYNELAKLICFTAVEVVILRQKEQKLYVLLTQRKTGEFYAGQWHSPGSILRASDACVNDKLPPNEMTLAERYEPAIKRVLIELGYSRVQVDDGWLGYFDQPPVAIPGFPYKTPRGTENALVILGIWGDKSDDPPKGQWVVISELIAEPENYNIIPHNLYVIRQAAWAYAHALPQS